MPSSQNYYFIFVKQYYLQIINRFKVLIKKCHSICNVLVDKIQHTLICLSDERLGDRLNAVRYSLAPPCDNEYCGLR